MAVLKREELIEKIKNYVGERDDDESISVLEDVTDTLSEVQEDLMEKIAELEKQSAQIEESWRKKYRERFNSGKEDQKEKTVDTEDTEKEEEEEIKIEDLFKEREE